MKYAQLHRTEVDLPGRGTTAYIDTADAGDGGDAGADDTPLLLLHGLGVTASINWSHAIERLSGERRIIAMDLRGHGRGVDDTFSLDACADDAIALLDTLGIDAAVVVGYSMGGAVGQLIAHHHQDRVVGLVPCATAMSFADPFTANATLTVAALTAIASEAPSLVRDQMARFVWRRGPMPSLSEIVNELQPMNRSSVARAAAACLRFNSRAWIRDIEVPVASVVTTRDAVVPAYRQLQLAKAIEDHTVHLVDGDHMACVRRPDAFASQLEAACASVMTRAEVRDGHEELSSR